MPFPSFNAEDLKKNAANAPARSSGFRRFYPLSLRRTEEGWQVRVNWARLAVATVIVLSLGWLGLASAAYAFIKYQRGITDVRFTDIVLARYQAYQITKGNFLIRTAQAQFKAEKYRAAIYNLRVGVAKSPANKEGRLLLAQCYGAWKRSDLAQQTLLEGLTYHRDDPDYLRLLFTFLLQRQEDERALTLCKELLGKDTTPTPRNQLVALAAASASFFRGNYDQTEDYMRMFNLATSRDGRLLSARIAWERGAKDLALTQLGQLTSDFPNDEEIYTQNLSYLHEVGRDEEARRGSLLRSISNPADARARIDLLYALQKKGADRDVNENADEILRDFARNPNVILALADFAADTGNPALARRVYDYANANKITLEGTALKMVEANVVAKQYQAALELVRQLFKDNPDWGRSYYAMFNGLQAIAHYGLGDAESAQVFLNNFLTQNTLRAENLISVSKRLAEVGAKTQARQVLAQAFATDPLNQSALTGLVQLDLQLNNADTLAANVRKLLYMRKPAKDVLANAYKKLGSDLFLFAPGRLALLQDLRVAIGANPTDS